MGRDIIIGYDPAHRGDDVLKLGRLFADVLAARPVVISTMPWPNQMADDAPPKQRVEEALEEHLALARWQLGDLGVETVALPSASPAYSLNEYADADPGARLIVLGSSHHGALGRTLLGGVGESLLHGAPCAVAVAPRGYGEREQRALQRIAIAFDGGEESRVALATAIGLAVRCHASITVVAVADYPQYGYATAWSVLSGGEVADADHRKKRELLDEAVALIPATTTRDTRLLTGSPGHELAEISAEFDLLVTGSRAYGPVQRTLLGSTTRKLLRGAACPVLVLPRGAGPDPLGVDLGEPAEATTPASPPTRP
jgi:nucleotide-binding universal stress UspA family protein